MTKETRMPESSILVQAWAGYGLLLVDLDAPAADGLGIGGIDVVRRAKDVIINDCSARAGDLDAELVRTTTAGDLAVRCGQQELIDAAAVHRARTLVFRFGTSHHELLILGAVK